MCLTPHLVTYKEIISSEDFSKIYIISSALDLVGPLGKVQFRSTNDAGFVGHNIRGRTSPEPGKVQRTLEQKKLSTWRIHSS